MEKTLEIDPVLLLEVGCGKRTFARICQLITENGTLVNEETDTHSMKKVFEISIPFSRYDEIDNDIVIDNVPDGFNNAVLTNIRAMNILEVFLNKERTDFQSLADAHINEALCDGNTLYSSEDEDSNCVVFKLESEKSL